MSKNLRLCIDRVFPAKHQNLAQEIAIKANPDNDPTRRPPAKMALTSGKMWAPGETLRIRFLDGTSAMHTKVIRAAKPWEEHANIFFDFGDHPNAQIRISFSADLGSWSAVGTDALVEPWFPAHQPTMNFGWLKEGTDDEEYSRVVLHEFGHALGCIHEHQSPGAKIKWKKEAVYAAFSGPPGWWTPEEIEHNVFERYDQATTQFSAFDPTSIMIYPIPAELTEDGKGIAIASTLSATDIDFIKRYYYAR